MAMVSIRRQRKVAFSISRRCEVFKTRQSPNLRPKQNILKDYKESVFAIEVTQVTAGAEPFKDVDIPIGTPSSFSTKLQFIRLHRAAKHRPFNIAKVSHSCLTHANSFQGNNFSLTSAEPYFLKVCPVY